MEWDQALYDMAYGVGDEDDSEEEPAMDANEYATEAIQECRVINDNLYAALTLLEAIPLADLGRVDRERVEYALIYAKRASSAATSVKSGLLNVKAQLRKGSGPTDAELDKALAQIDRTMKPAPKR